MTITIGKLANVDSQEDKIATITVGEQQKRGNNDSLYFTTKDLNSTHLLM